MNPQQNYAVDRKLVWESRIAALHRSASGAGRVLAALWHSRDIHGTHPEPGNVQPPPLRPCRAPPAEEGLDTPEQPRGARCSGDTSSSPASRRQTTSATQPRQISTITRRVIATKYQSRQMKPRALHGTAGSGGNGISFQQLYKSPPNFTDTCLSLDKPSHPLAAPSPSLPRGSARALCSAEGPALHTPAR